MVSGLRLREHILRLALYAHGFLEDALVARHEVEVALVHNGLCFVQTLAQLLHGRLIDVTTVIVGKFIPTSDGGDNRGEPRQRLRGFVVRVAR